MSTTHCNTTVSSIDPDGDRDSRTKAMLLLIRRGYTNFQSPDWLPKNPEGRIESIEVKNKKLYEPPPFTGTGLNVSQVEKRMQLLKDLGCRTLYINFVPGTDKVYAQYLDQLENGEFYDTSEGIRIYPLSSFEAIHNSQNQN